MKQHALPPKKMRKVCAWCSPGLKAEGNISHGICRRHAQEIRDDIDAEVKRERNRMAITGIIAELCEAHDANKP